MAKKKMQNHIQWLNELMKNPEIGLKEYDTISNIRYVQNNYISILILASLIKNNPRIENLKKTLANKIDEVKSKLADEPQDEDLLEYLRVLEQLESEINKKDYLPQYLNMMEGSIPSLIKNVYDLLTFENSKVPTYFGEALIIVNHDSKNNPYYEINERIIDRLVNILDDDKLIDELICVTRLYVSLNDTQNKHQLLETFLKLLETYKKDGLKYLAEYKDLVFDYRFCQNYESRLLSDIYYVDSEIVSLESSYLKRIFRWPKIKRLYHEATSLQDELRQNSAELSQKLNNINTFIESIPNSDIRMIYKNSFKKEARNDHINYGNNPDLNHEILRIKSVHDFSLFLINNSERLNQEKLESLIEVLKSACDKESDRANKAEDLYNQCFDLLSPNAKELMAENFDSCIAIGGSIKDNGTLKIPLLCVYLLKTIIDMDNMTLEDIKATVPEDSLSELTAELEKDLDKSIRADEEAVTDLVNSKVNKKTSNFIL